MAVSRLRVLVDPPVLLGARPGAEVEVKGSEARRLVRVMRVRPGEEVQLFDGRGRAWNGHVMRVAPGRLAVRLSHPEPEGAGPEPVLRLVLLQAVPKGDRMELALEKATELGVSEVWPVITKRSVVRPDGSGGRLVRWRRVVETAARQAGRLAVPEVRPPLAWDRALLEVTQLGGRWARIVAWEQAEGPLTAVLSRGAAPDLAGVVMAAGPEGGLTRDEVRLAESADFEVVSLGPRVLRAETAGWVMLALVQAWWGDLVGSLAGAGLQARLGAGRSA